MRRPYHADPVHQQMQELADRLAAYFAPRTTAYHELWLTDESNGEAQLVGGGSNGHEVEPIFHITAQRDLKKAILVLSPGWLEGMTVNTIESAPTNEGSASVRPSNRVHSSGFAPIVRLSASGPSSRSTKRSKDECVTARER